MINQATYNRIYKSGHNAGLIEKLRGQEMADAHKTMDSAADALEEFVERVIHLISETEISLRTPRARLKSFDVEEREIIRAEENGYAIMADALRRKLRDQAFLADKAA